MYRVLLAVYLGLVVAGFAADTAAETANSTVVVAQETAPVIPQANNRNIDWRCGRHHGSCPEGMCCSMSGYCGSTPAHCMAPDCQYQYGSGCDALKRPGGEDTSYYPRPQIGNVPYGNNPVYKCTVRNTVALTYDDGPNVYTSDLLDLLDSYNAKATFFINAINSNKGQIDDEEYPWADIVRRMYNSGHQVASHTWSHQDLDKMPTDLRREQMIKNEVAIRNIIGVFPTYMRPPYSSCSARSGCLQDMDDLGYHVVYFNVDTDDYNNASPHFIQRSKNIFDNAVNMHESVGWPLLVIAHDVHEQTVYNLTAHMLQSSYAGGYHPVTLGECLADPKSNWYRGYEPDKGKREVSLDGRCGDASTCANSGFGNCCSANGWCGNSPAHCGPGCQWAFGTCDGSVESPDGYDRHRDDDGSDYDDSSEDYDESDYDEEYDEYDEDTDYDHEDGEHDEEYEQHDGESYEKGLHDEGDETYENSEDDAGGEHEADGEHETGGEYVADDEDGSKDEEDE